jgi:HSP20 family molecular chaperone IbpA
MINIYKSSSLITTNKQTKMNTNNKFLTLIIVTLIVLAFTTFVIGETTTTTAENDKSNKQQLSDYQRSLMTSFMDPIKHMRRMMHQMMKHPLFGDELQKQDESEDRFDSMDELFKVLEEDMRHDLVPFSSRFGQIASSVDEQDDRYIFKTGIPTDVKKENLSVKVINEGGRDVLDITSNVKTDKGTTFFEKRYVFGNQIDKDQVKAKFNDADRTLVVEVMKKPEESRVKQITVE